MTSIQAGLNFTYHAQANGSVRISRDGRAVTTLRLDAAAKFLARAEGASEAEIQQLCARVTGNYKRGNESVASVVRGAKGR